MASRRILASVIAIIVLAAAVAAFAVTWRPAIAAIGPPKPASFDAALVKRGRVLAAIGGLIVGSFLNVVAYRLPRGESLVRPGSRCPACGTAVKGYDNVPLFGWLLLHGRCRA